MQETMRRIQPNYRQFSDKGDQQCVRCFHYVGSDEPFLDGKCFGTPVDATGICDLFMAVVPTRSPEDREVKNASEE
jgi:hypothetical protein